MKTRVKLFFNKSRSPKEKLKVDGAKSVSDALSALVPLLNGTKATKAVITITVPRRLSS